MRRIIFIFALLLSVQADAQTRPDFTCPFPVYNARTNDYIDDHLVYDYSSADVLSASQEIELNKRLINFELETSNQFVVFITDTLCGFEPGPFSFELIDEWGIGQEKQDNGLVILIKPVTKSSKGEVFIATGKGLEGGIPDGVASDVYRQLMIPRFKNNDFYGAVDEALKELMPRATGEFKERSDVEAEFPYEFLIALFIFFGFFGLMTYLRIRNYAKLNKISFKDAAKLILFSGGDQKYEDFNQGTDPFGGYVPGSGRRSGGNWMGGSGGFGGGSSGGGGFGGFGGGSSGGGGAGGSWNMISHDPLEHHHH